MRKTKRSKRKKLPSLGNLKKKAWEHCSIVVRQMYADHRGMIECVTCRKELHWKEAHAGHFVPRARGIAVYFECRNIHPQCPGCNFFGGEMAKIKYTQWMITMYGEDEVDRLLRLANSSTKRTRIDYEELIEHYKLCEEEL